MFDANSALKSLLLANQARFREIQHVAEGRSEQIAQIRGHDNHIAAKAMVLACKETKKTQKYYLAVLPGDHRLSFDKVKAHTGKRASMASLDKVQELTGCQPGAVPPFSFHEDLKLLVDPEVARQDPEIVFNAGSLERSIFLHTQDYMSITKPTVVDMSEQPEEK